MSVPTPKPVLLDGTAELINSCLAEIIGEKRFGYHHKGMALDLSKVPAPGPELKTLVVELFERIRRNWIGGDQMDRGADNWRWIVKTDKAGDRETKCERHLVVIGNGSPSSGRWVNQVPTGSGLSPAAERPAPGAAVPQKAKGAGHLDLAYSDERGGLLMIELKLDTYTPVCAALQLVRYALILILARENPMRIKIKDPRWRDAKRLGLRVLGPRNYPCKPNLEFYACEYKLRWFEVRLKEAVAAFGRNHGIEMSFAFRIFDWTLPPSSESELLRCLEFGEAYPD